MYPSPQLRMSNMTTVQYNTPLLVLENLLPEFLTSKMNTKLNIGLNFSYIQFFFFSFAFLFPFPSYIYIFIVYNSLEYILKSHIIYPRVIHMQNYYQKKKKSSLYDILIPSSLLVPPLILYNIIHIIYFDKIFSTSFTYILPYVIS